MNLEQACGLHERIKIIYVVDGYLATLADHEGERELFTAKGKTVQEAINWLSELIRPYASIKEMKLAAQIRIEAQACRQTMRMSSNQPSVQNIPKIQNKNRLSRPKNGIIIIDNCGNYAELKDRVKCEVVDIMSIPDKDLYTGQASPGYPEPDVTV